jgi:hypothetical protein
LPKISSPSTTLAAAAEEESAAAVTHIRCCWISSMLRRWAGSILPPVIISPRRFKARDLSTPSIEVRRESFHDDISK